MFSFATQNLLPKLSCFGLLKPPKEIGDFDEEQISSTMLQLPPEYLEHGVFFVLEHGVF